MYANLKLTLKYLVNQSDVVASVAITDSEGIIIAIHGNVNPVEWRPLVSALVSSLGIGQATVGNAELFYNVTEAMVTEMHECSYKSFVSKVRNTFTACGYEADDVRFRAQQKI